MFMRTPRSFVGHNAPLVRPRASPQLDYEGELVIVIGKAGRHIKESAALDHIAAITLCNEGTIRDWVRHAKFNVTQGKNFDSTGSLGPWLVPYTSETQIADVRLTTKVNGETRQDDRTGRLIFGFRYLLNYISTFTTLVPGDVILTGTPTRAALRTAFGGNEAVLCLTGQVPTAFLGKGRGHLHEMPDQLATLRTFVKWADRIEYPDDAPAKVSRAFQEMLSGRRGPVSLEMPWDVFTQRAKVAGSKPFDPFPAPQPDPDRIKAAADLIKGSKRPMIFVGSGAIGAREEILELAEMIDAPVVAFRSGRGIVSNAHELGLTMEAAYKLWPTTDLMIRIRTRLKLPTMSRWPYRPDGLKSIRIDIDPSEMLRYTPETAVIADAKAS